MAKNVAITVRVPVMMTLVVHTEESDPNAAIADAMHLASRVDMHNQEQIQIQRIEPTGSPCYVSEAFITAQHHKEQSSTAATLDIFSNCYTEGVTQQEALNALAANSDSRVLVLGYHSKTSDPQHVKYISMPLPEKEAFEVYDQVVNSNKYGCVIVINGNSLIKRQRVAERGGWELNVKKINGNSESFCWLASRKEALSKATELIQRDIAEQIVSIDIIDYTQREKGPITWKTLSAKS